MPVNGFSESTSSVMPTVNACDSAAAGTALGAAEGVSSACTAAMGASRAQVTAAVRQMRRGDSGFIGASDDRAQGRGSASGGRSPTPGRKDAAQDSRRVIGFPPRCVSVRESAPALLGSAVMVTPPLAPRHPHVRHLHGRDVPDDFAWMADGGQDLTAYLRAELDHYAAATAPLEPLRRRLFTEMVSRTPLAEEGPAHCLGAAEFRDMVPDGAQLGQFQRRGAGAQEWSTLLDLDAEAAALGSTYGEVGVREVSPDGSLLAWSLDSTGEELYELRFRDVATGTDLPERMPRTYYGGAWAADGRTFFYTVVDHVYRPHQVWRHVVGHRPGSRRARPAGGRPALRALRARHPVRAVGADPRRQPGQRRDLGDPGQRPDRRTRERRRVGGRATSTRWSRCPAAPSPSSR